MHTSQLFLKHVLLCIQALNKNAPWFGLWCHFANKLLSTHGEKKPPHSSVSSSQNNNGRKITLKG